MSQCVCDGTVDPAKYITHLERELAERDAEVTQLQAKMARLRDWLDNNATFFNVDHAELSADDVNVPVLAKVAKRIWYHATDDTESYPFSEVVATDLLKQSQP